jgi:four helix bundle protein
VTCSAVNLGLEFGHLSAGLCPTLCPTLCPLGCIAGHTPKMFSLEKLKVYDRALASTASLIGLAAAWDKRHAVVDQLVRASESVALNIAEGARLRGTSNRQHVLDYAIGSALECAACLDIAVQKQFLSPALALDQKQCLNEVVRQIDKTATSAVLNLAEGNGRCLNADRRRFLELAESATVKAAAYLDLASRTGEVDRRQRGDGKALLDRMSGLVRGLCERTHRSQFGLSEAGEDKV